MSPRSTRLLPSISQRLLPDRNVIASDWAIVSTVPLPFVARGLPIHSSVEPLCRTVNVIVHTLPRPWAWPVPVAPLTATLPARASTVETKLDGVVPPWFRKSPSCTDFTERYQGSNCTAAAMPAILVVVSALRLTVTSPPCLLY